MAVGPTALCFGWVHNPTGCGFRNGACYVTKLRKYSSLFLVCDNFTNIVIIRCEIGLLFLFFNCWIKCLDNCNLRLYKRG